MESENIIQEIAFNVIQGRLEAEDEGFDEGLAGKPGVIELVEQAIEQNVDIKDIILHGLTEAMDVVGKKFNDKEYLIPDMLASAECVGAAMEILQPYLLEAGVEEKEKFIIATVKDDLHDIGKNIVSIMIKGAGFDVIDLGADVPVEDIVAAVKEHQAPFLGLSALLTTTMRSMEDVIKGLSEEGLRDQVKVLIGGAPTSPEFADSIGADGYCQDAFEAVEKLKQFSAAG
ncbi:MAG: corrinoid protein [Deltaproteobacteria bacterium]|nr:corrinoid protein [Deltaproteobacteria bacterium]